MLYGDGMSKKQILLTGSTGFVGRSFLRLYDANYDIKTVNLRTTDIETISMDSINTVLHCAALVHQMKGAPVDQYFKINTELTQKLAVKAKQDHVSHFVFVSTAHVYGQNGNLVDHSQRLTESSPCHPTDAYGQSKLQAETLLLGLQDQNFKVSIVRSPLVYGPGGKGNLNSLRNLITVCPALPFAYPFNRRSLIFVDNLAYFISLIINQSKSGIYLPQDEQPISIQSFVQYIALAIHKKVILFRLPKFIFQFLCKVKPNIAQRLFGTLALNSDVSNKVLGYVPLVSTADAFKTTFDSAQ